MSTVFELILVERRGGTVRCGTTGAAQLEGVAAAFGLSTDAAIYRETSADAARELMIDLLHRELAYGSPLMSRERAAELADRFLLDTGGRPRRFFTNMTAPRPAPDKARVRAGPSWNPATEATFDMGVLVVGSEGSACFWVEDED